MVGVTDGLIRAGASRKRKHMAAPGQGGAPTPVAASVGIAIRQRGRQSVMGGILVVAGLLATQAVASAAGVPLGEFGQLALRCAPDVAPATLASIANVESRFEPLAINDNSTRIMAAPATADIAVQTATRLIAAGHSVDLGLMQINSGNLARLGLTPATAFDPCQSIAAAARILVGSYVGGATHDDQQAALREAISDYNTGNAVDGFGNGYVHKVELSAAHVVPAIDVANNAGPPLPTTGAPAASRGMSTAAAAPLPRPVNWDVWAAQGDPTPPDPVQIAGNDAGATVVIDNGTSHSDGVPAHQPQGQVRP